MFKLSAVHFNSSSNKDMNIEVPDLEVDYI